MSFDTLQLEVVFIEDTSGNVRDSLLSRRFFTKAAGDFSDPPDDRISLEDLAVFISSWNSNDFSKNLGLILEPLQISKFLKIVYLV